MVTVRDENLWYSKQSNHIVGTVYWYSIWTMLSIFLFWLILFFTLIFLLN